MYAVKNKRCILLKSDSKEDKMDKVRSTKILTLMGVLIAIEMILSFTPLGFIPLVFMKATTLHIPVIIGAVLLGPIEGGILGLVFGVLSVITNTTSPGLTSFVFSPFITIGGVSGNFVSLVIAIVPRVLIGLTAYYSYSRLKQAKLSIRTKKREIKLSEYAYEGAALIGAMTNTILVMAGIYLFFGQQYAVAKDIAFEALFGAIMGVVFLNGIPEAIVGAVIVGAVCKILNKVFKKGFN